MHLCGELAPFGNQRTRCTEIVVAVATAATNALEHEADIAKMQEWLGMPTSPLPASTIGARGTGPAVGHPPARPESTLNRRMRRGIVARLAHYNRSLQPEPGTTGRSWMVDP
jgi:hypothetical protein